MVNPTSLAVQQIHHQQWLADIRACNERPASMTVEEWCQQHGIKKNTYYWRMKSLRKLCLLEARQPPTDSQAAEVSAASSFVEISQMRASVYTETVTLTIGNTSIEIPETISDHFLRRILEAAGRA